MKPSNLSTPRTMADCTFTVGYSSGPQRMDREDRIVVWGSAIVAAAFVIMAASGWLQ